MKALRRALRSLDRSFAVPRTTSSTLWPPPCTVTSPRLLVREFSVDGSRLAKASAMDTIRNTIAENFGGIASKIGTSQFSLEECPDLSRKVAVITGGSQGIGFGVAYTLLKNNIAKVYIISTAKDVFDGARRIVAEELGQDKADRMTWMQCDLSDWRRTKQVAETIRHDTDRLDILVNNSGRGVMAAALTDYGVDRHMAVNHFGHAVLTGYLLPLLKQTAEQGNVVRISNQSSNAHWGASKDTQFASLGEINRDAGPNGQYGRSKLASLLYTRYFDRNVTQNGNPNVLINATHPGFVRTKQSTRDIHEP
jgi:NAD(P)-dependent dehydrogenase (short-subunit alcohol dehydrogenase family)